MASSTEYKNKFISENYDRINLTVKKGDKERIASRAKELGMSTNSYINDLILRDLEETPQRPQRAKSAPEKEIDYFLL